MPIETPLPPLPRFWLDVMFNDQNATDMTGVLAKAEEGYKKAPYHYALMRNDPFSRGWCLFEVVVRIRAAMHALDLRRPEDIVPLILRRHRLLPRLVIVPGLTNVDTDVTGKRYDRFGRMRLFDPADMVRIKRRIVEVCASAAAFNLLISRFRAATIQHHTRQATPPSK